MNAEAFAAAQRAILPALPVVNMTGKTVLITGANAGIGYQLARYYLRNNVQRLVMVTRTHQRGLEAAQRATAETNVSMDKVQVEEMDMTKLTSVKACATRLVATLPQLHILHSNAGLASIDKQMTEDGYETTAQVNWLAASQFALLMHPLLLRTAQTSQQPTRHVFTCTDGIFKVPDDVFAAHEKNGVLHQLAVERTWPKEEQVWHYTATKNLLANFAREYARRIQGQPVSVWLAAPGLTQTEFGQKDAVGVPREKQEDNTDMYGFVPRTPEEGAKTVLLAAIGNDEAFGWSPDLGDAVRLSNCKLFPGPEETTGDRPLRRSVYADIQRKLGPRFLPNLTADLVA